MIAIERCQPPVLSEMTRTDQKGHWWRYIVGTKTGNRMTGYVPGTRDLAQARARAALRRLQRLEAGTPDHFSGCHCSLCERVRDDR